MNDLVGEAFVISFTYEGAIVRPVPIFILLDTLSKSYALHSGFSAKPTSLH